MTKVMADAAVGFISERSLPRRTKIGPEAIAFLLIAVVVFYAVPQTMADPDIWWHLRDAQIQLATHSFLRYDLFSWTAAGSPWMNHEWLAELPFYAGYHMLGATGVYVVALLTIEVIFLGLLYLAYAASGSLVAASSVTILGILISGVSFGPRTLLFGWLLLVAELVIFSRFKEHTAVVWALPAIFLLWINTHGSWLIGMVVFTMFVASNCISLHCGGIENSASSRDRIRRLIVSWALSVAALFANPYGWRLLFYPFNLAFQQKLNIATVEEWTSLDFHTPRGRILLLCLALLFLYQLARGRNWALFELAITFVGIYSALTYSRFLFLAALLAMPSLALSIRSSKPKKQPWLSPLRTYSLLFLIFCLGAGKLRTQKMNSKALDEQFPVKALPLLSSLHLKGHVLNDFRWGGFLIWNEPDIPVFIDSRNDIFEYNGTFKDYLDIVHPKNTLALLDKYQARYVLFKSDSPLVYLLKATHDWKVTYEDNTTTLLERQGQT